MSGEGSSLSLTQVFAAKIVITAFFWCLPLLVAPPALFAFLGIPFPQPDVFIRLLGAAYAALLVGYWHGLQEARAGRPALAAVRMGVISNGLASAILACYGVTGAWTGWAWPGQAFMWFSLAATSAVTVGLLTAGKAQGQLPVELAGKNSP
jgi:hypothetical protein